MGGCFTLIGGGSVSFLFLPAFPASFPFTVLHDTSMCVTMLRSTAAINEEYTLQHNHHLTSSKPLCLLFASVVILCKLWYYTICTNPMRQEVVAPRGKRVEPRNRPLHDSTPQHSIQPHCLPRTSYQALSQNRIAYRCATDRAPEYPVCATGKPYENMTARSPEFPTR